MEKQLEIGQMMHRIMHSWDRLTRAKQTKAGLNNEIINNGRILGFLRRNAGTDVYQKDIEQETGLTKSAISNILTSLEKQGYVKRLAVEKDARFKKIVLTRKGTSVDNKLGRAFQYVDGNFTKGLTEEEQDGLIRCLRIIYDNMKEMEAEQ